MLALVCAPALAGCGGSKTPAMDAGTDAGTTDAGTPDSGPADAGPADAGPTLPTCDAPMTVMGTMGDVTVTGDTTDGPDGPLDPGMSCANTAAMRWSPQYVVAYQVPGTGTTAVSFTLVNSGTPDTFDTVVQVRTDCNTIPTVNPAATCFDETGMDHRSSGAVTAMGGDTIFFVVTGYAPDSMTDPSATDRGPFTMTISAAPASAPVLTDAAAYVIDNSGVHLDITGTDADGDLDHVAIRFLDASGMPVDVYQGMGPTGVDFVQAGFDQDPSGMMSFTGTVTIGDFGFGPTSPLGMVAKAAGATQASIMLVDSANAVSDMMMVPLMDATAAGLGATCDTTHICAPPLTCNSGGTCEAPPDITAACGTATAISVATPTTMTTSAMVTGSLDPGAGMFSFSCAPTPGTEALYTVDVPAGDYDLLATTDLSATMMTDTVLAVRATCEDPTTETCNDDVDTMGGNYKSTLEVDDAAAGTYTVFVDSYGGVTASSPFALQVSLRPVLMTGATCDPMGVMNRCAGGACPSGGTCP